MPGIITTYAEFADAHVAWLEKRGKKRRISRAKVEYQILQEIHKSDLLIDCKLSWTHAILSSRLFDALWDSISRRLKLPKSCTARFVPDPDLIQFEAPSDDEEADEGAKEVDGDVEEVIHDGPSGSQVPAVTNNQNSRQSSPDIVSSASGSTTPEDIRERAANMPTPTQVAARWAALPPCQTCGVRGHNAIYCPARPHEEAASRTPEPATEPIPTVRDENSRATLSEAEDSAHEARDDSYEEPSRQKKRPAKTKASTKAASKPQGIKKRKTAPKKKGPTPAQLETAAAKILEPANLNAAEPPSATPNPKATTPARPSNRTNNNPAHPSPAAPPLATPSTSTNNPPAAQPANPPDALGRKIARMQEAMAPAYDNALKRLRDAYPVDKDEAGPASKKVKTDDDSVVAVNGGGKIQRGKKGLKRTKSH